MFGIRRQHGGSRVVIASVVLLPASVIAAPAASSAAPSGPAPSGSPPAAVMSPASIDFGIVPIGAQTEPRVAVLTNTGGAPIEIVRFTTPTESIVYETTCELGVLPAGASCEFSVRFAPRGYGGGPTAVGVDTPVGHFGVTLHGTGIGLVCNECARSPGHGEGVFDFGAVTVGDTAEHDVTVTNTAVVPFVLEGPAEQSNDVFTLTSGCVGVLAPGATCTITMSFRSDVVGSYRPGPDPFDPGGAFGYTVIQRPQAPNADDQYWSVTIVADAVAAALSLAPDPVDIGVVPIDAGSGAATATLRNEGVASLPVTALGADTPFGVTYLTGPTACASPPFRLAAGETCDVQIDADYVAGASSGQLTAATVAGDFEFPLAAFGAFNPISAPSPIDFGSVAVGASSPTRSVTVTNGGNVDAELAAAVASPAFAIVDDGCGGTELAPGGTCDVTLRFDPAAAGDAAGTLELSGTGAGGAVATAVTLHGFGADADITAEPSDVAFGTVAPGETAARAVTVTNTGNVAVDLAIAVPAGVTADPAACDAVSLAPGDACDVAIGYAPTAIGTLADVVAITATADVGGVAVSDVAEVGVSGSATDAASALSASPNPLDFGDIELGSVEQRELTIENVAADPVGIDAVSLAGGASSAASRLPSGFLSPAQAAPGPFALDPDDCVGSMQPGDSCTITVGFAAERPGTFGDLVRIETSLGVVDIAVSAAVAPPPTVPPTTPPPTTGVPTTTPPTTTPPTPAPPTSGAPTTAPPPTGPPNSAPPPTGPPNSAPPPTVPSSTAPVVSLPATS